MVESGYRAAVPPGHDRTGVQRGLQLLVVNLCGLQPDSFPFFVNGVQSLFVDMVRNFAVSGGSFQIMQMFQARTANEQAEIANKQAEIANKQAEIANQLAEIAIENAKQIAKQIAKQAVIANVLIGLFVVFFAAFLVVVIYVIYGIRRYYIKVRPL